MIPGYATVYRDAHSLVHLYFFRGIDENFSPMLRKPVLRNLPDDIKYDTIEYDDYATEFIFQTDIRRINCSLIDINTNETKTLLFKGI